MFLFPIPKSFVRTERKNQHSNTPVEPAAVRSRVVVVVVAGVVVVVAGAVAQRPVPIRSSGNWPPTSRRDSSEKTGSGCWWDRTGREPGPVAAAVRKRSCPRAVAVAAAAALAAAVRSNRLAAVAVAWVAAGIAAAAAAAVLNRIRGIAGPVVLPAVAAGCRSCSRASSCCIVLAAAAAAAAGAVPVAARTDWEWPRVPVRRN